MPEPARRWTLAALGAACLALTLALYHPALGFYFVGDDVAFVHPRPDWLRTALLPAGEWHYYPLTQAGFALLGILSRWQPAPLHLLALVLHALVGAGLALWLARFGVTVWARWLAALFFLSRGIHYEVVIWITELSYLAVALCTLATLASWDRYLAGQGGRHLAWTALGFAIAVFTIEHALILAPLYLLYELAMRPASAAGETLRPPRLALWDARRGPGHLVRAALKYAPFVLIAVAFLAIKRAHHIGLSWSAASAALQAAPPLIPSGMELTTRLPPERVWLGMFNAPLRAWRDLLSAAGFLVLPSGLARTLDDGWLTRHAWLCLAPWLALHAGILWKGPRLARLLLGWIYLYELPLAVAGVPQARYHYLAALPAAALVALGAQAACSRPCEGMPRTAALALVAALAIAIGVGERRFISARMREWSEASGIVRGAVAELQRSLPAGTRELVLVNLPRGVPAPFGPAYAFANAAEHLPAMLRPPRQEVTVRTVYDRTFVSDRWPTIGSYASRDSIERLAQAPATALYEFSGAPPWLAPLR